MKKLNELLTFLLELAMIVLVPLALIATAEALWLKILLPIVADVALTVFWGLKLAPRARRRFGIGLGMTLATVLLFLSPAALFVMGDYWWAAAVLAVVAVNRVLAVVWKQW